MFFFDPAILSALEQPAPYFIEAQLPARHDCRRHRPLTSVDVKIDERPIVYDNSRSSAQLQGFQIDTVSPYGADVHTRISGLTEGRIDVSIYANFSVETHPGTATSCLWFDTVTITVRSAPTVYIASEHNNNRCRYQSTLNHELRHVEVDRRVVREYAPQMRRAVLDEVYRIGVVGPEPALRAGVVRAQMLESANAALQRVVGQMNSVRRTRQQAVDTKAEYDRLSRMCGGKF